MQFFKLLSSYLPGDTIQNFDSLVWTERYQDPGDFQLTISNEITSLNILALGTLVSHTDTTEVMMVENQELVKNEDHSMTITISGRSLETFMENRTTAGSEQPLNNSSGVAIVETVASNPAATIAVNLMKGRMEPGTASAANAIPNLRVLAEIREYDAAMSQVIQRGDLYSRIIELCKLGNAGLKNRRPLGAQTTLDMVVHDGADLSDTVIFYAQQEDLEDCKYFWSMQDFKDHAAIATDRMARVYLSRDWPVSTGLGYRVMYVEASDIKGSHPAVEGDEVEGRAQSELDQVPMLYLMTAKVTQTARPKFKINYDVGDLVTTYGEFEDSEIMRVTEHILTVDDKGARGFPSLSVYSY